MSLRWFIYYCTLCGGCAAYVGWVLGRLAPINQHVLRASIQGMFLGMSVAIVLTLIDTLWSLSGRAGLVVIFRILVAGLVGGVGGFVGGMVGQILLSQTQLSLMMLVGWSLTGVLIGVAPGMYDLLARLASDMETAAVSRKVRNGLIGGFAGGLLGGLFFLLCSRGWSDAYWTPSAVGFVLLGLCIGLMIGLAQVILMEAWIRVEAGFRSGRELILSRTETVIGRAEGSDIPLFGDMEVEKTHARIVLRQGSYLLEDENTQTGTYLNGELVTRPTPLQSGDVIEMGRSALRFGTRRKSVPA